MRDSLIGIRSRSKRIDNEFRRTGQPSRIVRLSLHKTHGAFPMFYFLDFAEERAFELGRGSHVSHAG